MADAAVGASTMAARCRLPRWWRRHAAAGAGRGAAGGWGVWAAPRAGTEHGLHVPRATAAAAPAIVARGAGRVGGLGGELGGLPALLREALYHCWSGQQQF